MKMSILFFEIIGFIHIVIFCYLVESQNISRKQDLIIYKYIYGSSNNYPQLESVSLTNGANIIPQQDASFNKTIFVVPMTGVLLVITMVILYIIYTWNLIRKESQELRGIDIDEIDHYFNFETYHCPNPNNSSNGSPLENSTDEPPSYSDVVRTKSGIHPPIYSEVDQN